VKANADELLRRLPGKASAQWPLGERFVQAMAHGTMSVELYAPVAADPQTPHAQDELYFIHAGSGTFRLGDRRHAFGPGDCFFVPAGVPHRFQDFSRDFATWVVFWGPPGGEGATSGS
jgi:mannose-6-phosphate isomerase-like protein (cupin superfamily)